MLDHYGTELGEGDEVTHVSDSDEAQGRVTQVFYTGPLAGACYVKWDGLDGEELEDCSQLEAI